MRDSLSTSNHLLMSRVSSRREDFQVTSSSANESCESDNRVGNKETAGPQNTSMTVKTVPFDGDGPLFADDDVLSQPLMLQSHPPLPGSVRQAYQSD